jgi:hypothetical protein
MSHPRFHIYAPTTHGQSIGRFSRLEPLIQNIANRLINRGFEPFINCTDKCDIKDIVDMVGLVITNDNGTINVYTVDDALIDMFDWNGTIICVQTYMTPLSPSDLRVIRRVFLPIYQAGETGVLTRSQKKLEICWTPHPRLYCIVASSLSE